MSEDALRKIIYDVLEFQLSESNIEEWQVVDYAGAIVERLKQDPLIMKEFAEELL